MSISEIILIASWILSAIF